MSATYQVKGMLLYIRYNYHQRKLPRSYIIYNYKYNNYIASLISNASFEVKRQWSIYTYTLTHHRQGEAAILQRMLSSPLFFLCLLVHGVST